MTNLGSFFFFFFYYYNANFKGSIGLLVIGSIGFFVLKSHLIASGISLYGYSLNILNIFLADIAFAILSLNSDA